MLLLNADNLINAADYTELVKVGLEKIKQLK